MPPDASGKELLRKRGTRWRIAQHGGSTTQFSDPNTVGEMLRRLEARKLVLRKAHPRDRRARCVYLTPKGRAFQRRLHEDSLAFHRQFEETFSAAERAALGELLARIPQRMDALPSSHSEAVA